MADIFDEIEVSEPDKKDIFDELEDDPVKRTIVAPAASPFTDKFPPGFFDPERIALDRAMTAERMEPRATAWTGFKENLNDLVGDVGRGFLRVIPGTMKTAGAVASNPMSVPGSIGRSVLDFIAPGAIKAPREPSAAVPEQNPLYKAGQGTENFIEETFPPPQEPELSRSVAEGLGQVGSMMVGGAGARALGAGLKGTAATAVGMGTAQEFDDAFTRSRKRGDDADTALAKSLGYATVAGLIENKLGAGRLLRQLFPSAAEAAKKITALGVSKKILGNFLAGGVEEGSQRVAQNWIVDEKPSMEGVMDEALPGAIVQGIAGLPSAGIGTRAQQPKTTLQPTVAQEVSAATVDEAAINRGLEGQQAKAVEAPVVTEETFEEMPLEEKGKVGHVPGMDYGLTLTQEDVPRLEAKYKQATAEMTEATKDLMASDKAMNAAEKSGDAKAMAEATEKFEASQINYAAAFGKNNFYGGALQGATRGTHAAAGSNFAGYAADRAAMGNPIPGYTVPTPATPAASTVEPLKPSEFKALVAANQPIPADRMDASGAPPPRGYVREGNFYVPEKAEAAAPATETTSTAPTPPVAPTTQRHHSLPQQEDVKDWTSATDEDQIVEFHAGIPLPKFANRKMSNLDKATTSHGSKVQKSFDEARRVQSEIRKQVGSERRQNAISVWREAAGDIPTLQAWAAAAKGKLFKQAAQDAQSLTAKEIAVANKVIVAFSVLERRGNRFDVLKGHRDNYVPHVWDVSKPGFGWGSSRLKERFRFSKARTFNNFFEGDQAGFKPKTLAIGKLLPAYIHEMNQTIADRQFVQDIAKGTMEDGSPMSVPTGNVTAVDNPSGKAVLIQPGTKKVADTSDYRVMSDQPALSNWIWKGNDTAGEPAFMKADLALHPDVFRRVNSMLGKSAIRTWYHDPVTGNARIPRAIVRGLDTAQAAMKREMFGLLAPFHQVQEGTHAIGHLVNPFFGTPKIDLRNPNQLDAARHGLMLLPDRATTTSYMEGVGAKASLLSRGIRKATPVGRAIADVIDGYQDYLFHQYIPGLKLKTYEALLSRNTKLYSKELASGEVTVADVKLVSAEQANAAYGHLNYALLDRNPTIQHLIQMAALAPDFLEARVRFTGQGIKGITSKTGHEQFKAIAILAVAQAGASIILSSLMGVPWDPEHPFEVVYKGRRYALRSVPEDIFSLLKDTRRFIYARVNPLTVKGAVQLATGLNYRGEKTTSMETMGELLAGYIPITARSIPGVRNLTETGRNNSITPLEQLAGSLGLRVSNYSPISETYKLAAEWMDSQKIKRDTGSYPVSKYQQLRYALEDGDMDRAREEYLKLKETMPRDKIYDGFKQSMSHPFTGSQDNDSKFSKSLKGYDRALYDLAVKKRKEIIGRFNGLPKQ